MLDRLEDLPVLTVLISVLCGAIVGFEREFKNKSAGFRTIILICLGSTIFTLTSRMGNISDDRIAANIVTGIGFIGAGVIYQGKFNVQGLTTAAVIWSMAGIGMIIGFGNYPLGFMLTLCMVVILSLFQKMESLLSGVYSVQVIHITFQSLRTSHLDAFENFLKTHQLTPQRKGVEKKGEHLTAVYEITGTQKNIGRAHHAIIELDYVYSFNNL